MQEIDFKSELITLYNAMRWKPNRTFLESKTCQDLRIFIRTKYRDDDTNKQLQSCDRGDYDPTNEKKTLRATLMSLTSQPTPLQSPTNSPNTSSQSGNAVEVSLSGISSDELKELEALSAKETQDFVDEVKKRGRKPKNV